MDLALRHAFATGYERMAAWSDLLDDINLYPVADADTGRNLRISLAPLKEAGHPGILNHLMAAATGNSGNIAAAFFAEFAAVTTPGTLAQAARRGQKAAWGALLDPQPGTMLTVFDAWKAATESIQWPVDLHSANHCITQLKEGVLSTSEILAALKQAGVVDAGALGMFLFFEGFIRQLVQEAPTFVAPTELFGAKLDIDPVRWSASSESGFCIDTIIDTHGDTDQIMRHMDRMGDSVVVRPEGRQLKIHFHTSDQTAAREKLAQLGDVVQWRQEKIEETAPKATSSGVLQPGVHIATDAAGSITRQLAREMGITLLDSYLIWEDRHVPETLVESDTLYAAMRQGMKVTTAQASIFERHQSYQSLLDRYRHTIYLCVGSVYTGIYEVACQWQQQIPANGRFTIIDSAAASGRLAILAMAVARFAKSNTDVEAVIAYANAAMHQCGEVIFIDQLKYLAAGGRISKAKGFFGDLFKVKPVITPGAQGVEKLGAVKTRNDQCQFALDHLAKHLADDQPAEMMVEYTDNQDWVRDTVCPKLEARFPQANITVLPMSLTSGVHMGPGTWGVAYLPSIPVGKYSQRR